MRRLFFEKITIVVFSIVVSFLLFIILGYTHITIAIVNVFLKLTGNNNWEGEERSRYIFDYVLILFAFIFIIVFLVTNKYMFKKVGKKT